MRETLKHKEAFEKYYKMGDNRTLASLADHLGITERTAKQWSRELHWQERILQRDLEGISQGNPQNIGELEKQIAALQDRVDTLENERMRLLSGSKITSIRQA